MALTFRSARPRDADAVADVARRTWRGTYAGMIPDAAIEAHLAAAYEPTQVAARIARADRFDVAEDEQGEVVGFAEWQLHGDTAELVATYVLPGCQRRGIGRAFHERAREGFADLASAFETNVLTANEGGRSFYESLGYRSAGSAAFALAGSPIEQTLYRLALGGEDG